MPVAGRVVFKWIKQRLRINVFFGTSENAVKTKIWTVVWVYVLVAIVKKGLNLSTSLHEMLQILSLTLFERIPLDQLLHNIITDDIQGLSANQLNLFDYRPDANGFQAMTHRVGFSHFVLIGVLM